MTDAQDLILDKLVGSKIGVNWPDGVRSYSAMSEITRRCGLAAEEVEWSDSRRVSG